MPTAGFNPPRGNQSTAQLQDWIVKLCRDLEYYMNNLDTVNINRLDARVIIADTVTADKMNVSQLSAIAADLGTITAGIIYGAYIATANGTYPRIEFSSSGNLLKAMQSATNYIAMSPNLFGPVLEFDNGVCQAFAGLLSTLSNAFFIKSTGDIILNTTSGSISATSSAGTISDIVGSINSLASSISSLSSALSGKVNLGASTSSVSVSDGHNHGFSNTDYIQCYDAVGTPTLKKQWVAYAGSVGHSHTV